MISHDILCNKRKSGKVENGMKKRKLPTGIENFEEIVEDYYYVDKTSLIVMIYTRCIPKIDETKYERSTDGN